MYSEASFKNALKNEKAKKKNASKDKGKSSESDNDAETPYEELSDEEKDARDYQLQRAMDMVIAMSKMQMRADIVPLTPADVPAVASDKKDDVSDNNDTKSESKEKDSKKSGKK